MRSNALSLKRAGRISGKLCFDGGDNIGVGMRLLFPLLIVSQAADLPMSQALASGAQ